MDVFYSSMQVCHWHQQWQWQVLLGSSPQYEHVLQPRLAIPDPLNLQDFLYCASCLPPGWPVPLSYLIFSWKSPELCSPVISLSFTRITVLLHIACLYLFVNHGTSVIFFSFKMYLCFMDSSSFKQKFSSVYIFCLTSTSRPLESGPELL